MIQNDRLSVPRFGSPRSGAVFERVISRKILLIPSSVTIQERRRREMELLDSFGRFRTLYSVPTMKGLSFDREVVELSGLLLDLTGAVLYSASVDLDPDRPDMKRWFDGMSSGASETLQGMLPILAMGERYRPSARIRFAELLKAVLPELLQHYSEKARKDIRVQIQEMKSKAKRTKVKKAIEGILGNISR